MQMLSPTFPSWITLFGTPFKLDHLSGGPRLGKRLRIPSHPIKKRKTDPRLTLERHEGTALFTVVAVNTEDSLTQETSSGYWTISDDLAYSINGCVGR